MILQQRVVFPKIHIEKWTKKTCNTKSVNLNAQYLFMDKSSLLNFIVNKTKENFKKSMKVFIWKIIKAI